MIKSTSYSQSEILKGILSLQKTTKFDVDLTYGRGGFYKDGVPEPHLKFDLMPGKPGVVAADARQVPLPTGSVGSVVFDPPFLATKGPSLSKKQPLGSRSKTRNVMVESFSRFDTEKELFSFYEGALRECYRILRPKGFLVFKCQDKVSSGKQYWSHILIANYAVSLGFYLKDLFILLAKSRIVAKWQLTNQKHARKMHAYFLVFEKR